MATNIYVGNIPSTTTVDELIALFRPFGQVGKAQIVLDRETGCARKFGFVEMPDETEAQAAIAALNNWMMNGRTLCVVCRHHANGVGAIPDSANEPEDAPLQGILTAEDIRQIEQDGLTLEDAIRAIEASQE